MTAKCKAGYEMNPGQKSKGVYKDVYWGNWQDLDDLWFE